MSMEEITVDILYLDVDKVHIVGYVGLVVMYSGGLKTG